jgi:hypothetical protein
MMIDVDPDMKTHKDFLESKCAYLTALLEQTILKYTSEAEVTHVETIKISQPVESTIVVPHCLNETDELILNAFLTLLGRAPSKDDIEFYSTNFNKYGRLRILRDIFLSHESVTRNRLPRIVVAILRIFWKT